MSARPGGARGPLPMADEVKKARGTRIRKKHNATEAPDYPKLEQSCPEYLCDLARAHWAEIVPVLVRAGVARETDVTAIAVYCEAYATWRRALDLFHRSTNEPGEGLLSLSTTGSQKASPAFKALTETRAALLTAAGHLGLSPATRARINAGPPPAPDGNKFGNNGAHRRGH